MGLLRWAIVVLYVAAMFVFAGNEISGATFTGRFLASWLPGASSAQIKRYVLIVRKLGHFSAYAILTLLVYWAAARTKKLRRATLPAAALLAFLVALADEGYQRFLVHRTGAWPDVLIDGAGIFVMAIGIMLQKRSKEKTSLEVMEDVKDELI